MGKTERKRGKGEVKGDAWGRESGVAYFGGGLFTTIVAPVGDITCIFWLLTGIIVYLLYGIRHSVAAKSLQHVPDEQRILLPDDDHVTQLLSDDVVSVSGRRQTGNSFGRAATSAPRL